jgi:hypothetical protein
LGSICKIDSQQKYTKNFMPMAKKAMEQIKKHFVFYGMLAFGLGWCWHVVR